MHLSISILPIQHLYLYIWLPVSLLRDTVSYFLCTRCPVREPTVHAECALKANSQRDNKRLHVRIRGVPKGRPALPSIPPPLLTPPAPSPPPPPPPPPHAHPYFAHYMQTSPKHSQHSAKRLFINFQSPPLREKVITTAMLFVCISISVSAIPDSMYANSLAFFLSSLFFPPSF